MNLHQFHVLVSQLLLKIQGANLKLKNSRFIANISPGIFRAVPASYMFCKFLFSNATQQQQCVDYSWYRSDYSQIMSKALPAHAQKHFGWPDTLGVAQCRLCTTVCELHLKVFHAVLKVHQAVIYHLKHFFFFFSCFLHNAIDRQNNCFNFKIHMNFLVD